MASNNDNTTITITFGDQAENHVGMQKIGQLAEEGFSLADLDYAREQFKDKTTCLLIDLNKLLPEDDNEDHARLLVIRNGLNILLNHADAADGVLQEQMALNWDSKAKMRGKVVNKHARHNLCFGEVGQEPDFAAGKGTIVSFTDLPFLNKIRAALPQFCGLKATDLQAEGNKYYDIAKECYIGFHGDAERRKVIALRLGATLPIHYQWYQRSEAVGTRFSLDINHGDIYMMSAKAVGTDWKKRIIPTLRHAAGQKSVLLKKTKCIMLPKMDYKELLI